jgi:hypothetical protein
MRPLRNPHDLPIMVSQPSAVTDVMKAVAVMSSEPAVV